MKRLAFFLLALALLLPSFAFADVPHGVIRYDGNGGVSEAFGTYVDQKPAGTHLRENTLQGTGYFHRDGYLLTGWNTEPDGTGTHIGLGSRVAFSDGLILYAEWQKASDPSDFSFRTEQDGIVIEGYTGGSVCAVPERINDSPVRSIAAGAFAKQTLSALFLPETLRSIASGAFSACTIRELTLYDNLKTVSDASFADTSVQTIRINAAVAPVYSGSYFDTFSDKFDYLQSLGEAQTLVLFSGSSGRYGYDSAAIEAAFPAYRVVNMGVYAYTNALPQLELIRTQLQSGDLLLDAPEFDAVPEQFCMRDSLDAGFWAMMESNYDNAALLDCTRYSAVFDSFSTYQQTRGGMVGRNYGESPFAYDDEGNRYNFPTYNRYGDFILPRPNSARDELHRHNIADYTVSNVTPEAVEALNRALKPFTDDGITVLFTYAPRNRSSLTEASTPAARRALERELQKLLAVPILSSLSDSLYSGIYFWEIDNHLSTEGVQLRTNAVIRDLKAQMGADGLILPADQPARLSGKTLRTVAAWSLYGLSLLLALCGTWQKRWRLLTSVAGVAWAAATVAALTVGASQTTVLLGTLVLLLALSVRKRGDGV